MTMVPPPRWTGPELLSAEVVLSIFFFWGMIRLTDIRATPFHVVLGALRNALRSPRIMRDMLWLTFMLFLNWGESAIDPRITGQLGYDLTPWIHAIEGDAAAFFQAWDSPVATYFFSIVYILGFTVMMVGTVLVLAHLGREQALRQLTLGYALNVCAAAPFYLFVPVNESWIGNPAVIRLKLNDVNPLIMDYYRSGSAPDNCFPSLHTSLAITIAYVAWSTRLRRLEWFNAVAAAIVIYSTLYLGIHWISDVVAGCALGAAICLVLRRFGQGR